MQGLYRNPSFIGQVLIASSQLNLTPSFSRIPEQPGSVLGVLLGVEAIQ